jgi:hypothetical protein
MKYAVEMDLGGMICIPSFVNTGKGVGGILRVCLRSSKGFNVGITADRIL